MKTLIASLLLLAGLFGAGQASAVEQSIRDPELRARVGLEERARW